MFFLLILSLNLNRLASKTIFYESFTVMAFYCILTRDETIGGKNELYPLHRRAHCIGLMYGCLKNGE